MNWGFYTVGLLLHIWLKAGGVIGSANEVNTFGKYLNRDGRIIVVRAFAATCFFIIWVYGGAAVLGDHGMPSLNGLTPIVKAAVCGLTGLAMDSILDKIVPLSKWLSGAIPPATDGKP